MSSKINEEVGKKIVEALKKQSAEDNSDVIVVDTDDLTIPEETEIKEIAIEEDNNDKISDIKADETILSKETEVSDMSFDKSENKDDFDFEFNIADNMSEIPSNILILKKLVSQLPSGVSRQMGAQIIKQTMEALGVSMESLIEEAQEVQINFKNSTKECQNTIQDYKNKIKTLEKQVSDYKKHYNALNDLINLFVKTTK